jgi:hypothetical protein
LFGVQIRVRIDDLRMSDAKAFGFAVECLRHVASSRDIVARV